MERYQKKIIFLSFSIILLIRFFYIVTFPLNFGGDASIYFHMILWKQSNLLMAGGYPFLMMIPYHFFQLIRGVISKDLLLPPDLNINDWWRTPQNWLEGTKVLDNNFSWIDVFSNREFIFFQHGIEILSLIAGFLLVKKYFGFAISLIFLFFYGLSPLSLEGPSSVAPEWLQSSLLVFSIFFADKAINSPFAKKTLLYFLMGLLTALCFLTKFNSLPLLLVLFIFLLFIDRDKYLKTIYKVSIFLVSSFSLIILYIFTYHLPTTGSGGFTKNSWILADKIFQFLPGKYLDPQTGINTKRLLAIEKRLPSKDFYSAASYFSNINFVDDETRSIFRKQLLPLMNANEEELDSFILLNGIYYISNHQPLLRIAYFLGLDEYNVLLKNIYFEHIQKYPREFLIDTLSNFWKGLISSQKTWGFRPQINEVNEGKNKSKTAHLGFVQFLWPKYHMTNLPLIAYHNNVVFLPGVYFFEKFELLWPPTYLFWALSFIALITAIKNFSNKRSYLVVTIGIALLFFVGFSNIIYLFRLKEYRFIFPLVSLLAAVGFWQVKLLIQITFLKLKLSINGE